MDAAPINPSDLTALLQSGGNAAAIGALWIGFKLLGYVRDFLANIATALKQNVETNLKVIESVKKLREDIRALTDQLAIVANVRVPRGLIESAEDT